MLKAKQIVLLDGNVIENVEVIPTEVGFLLLLEESGKAFIREIPKERISYVDYDDSKTMDLIKGIALVPIVEDIEEVDAIYEEYGDLTALVKSIEEAAEEEVAKPDESASPLTKNPYGDE